MSRIVRLEAMKDSLKEAERFLESIPGGVEKVSMRAINRSLTAGKTAMKRHIAAHYTVDKGTVDDAIQTRRASPHRLEGELSASGSPLSSRHFEHDPSGFDTTGSKRRQIRLRVKKKGSGKQLKSGFLWDGGWGSGKRSIYVRTGEKRRASTGHHAGKRYMVESLKKSTSPSVPQMAANEGGQEQIQERMQEIFEKRVDHETRLLLEKGVGKK